MRSVALARYRFLMSIRSSGGAIGGLIAVAGSTLLGSFLALQTMTIAHSEFRFFAPRAFSAAATTVGPTYLLHLLALVAVCFLFGTPQRRSDQPAADLMQTTPVTAAEAFWGDCLGVLAATLSIHMVAVPLLAFLVALSPHQSSTFWFLEAVVIVVLFLVSAVAAWSLRAASWRWSIARNFRASVIVAIILAGAAGLFARRPAGLFDALVGVFESPGPGSLRVVLEAFRDPPAATIVFALLYAAFVAFFFIHSVRRSLRE